MYRLSSSGTNIGYNSLGVVCSWNIKDILQWEYLEEKILWYSGQLEVWHEDCILRRKAQSLKLWLTSIILPSNTPMASAKVSMVLISRWLAGLSRKNTWGFCQASQGRYTWHFCTSDRFQIGLTYCFPVRTYYSWSSSFLPSPWSLSGTLSCAPKVRGLSLAALINANCNALSWHESVFGLSCLWVVAL